MSNSNFWPAKTRFWPVRLHVGLSATRYPDSSHVEYHKSSFPPVKNLSSCHEPGGKPTSAGIKYVRRTLLLWRNWPEELNCLRRSWGPKRLWHLNFNRNLMIQYDITMIYRYNYICIYIHKTNRWNGVCSIFRQNHGWCIWTLPHSFGLSMLPSGKQT